MKKGSIIIALILVAVVVVTGCDKKESSKKMVCTTTVSGVDVTFNVSFKGDKVTAMDFNYDMDLSSYSDVQIKAIEAQEFCPIVKRSFVGFSDAFENCKQKVANKHLLVDANINVDKVDDSLLTGSQEKTKEALEKLGYSCK